MLKVLAWVNIGLHLVALVLAATSLRPGSPLVALPERLEYLAGSPIGWSVGWSVWMLCALVLVAYCAALAGRLGGAAPSLAVALAAAGAGVDLLCDSVYITVLPGLAASVDGRTTFVALERLANAGGLIVANGLYGIAVAILSTCLGRRVRAPGTVMCGWSVFASAMVLVLAGLIGSASLAAAGTAPTIGLFCLWVLLAARYAPSQKSGAAA